MKIEIDQSGKIENTSKLTVLTFSNDKNGSVVILAKDKKMLQSYFRRIDKPRLFAVLGFTVLVFILIKSYLANGCSIVIDREYPGFEDFISQKLREFIKEGTKIKDFRIYTQEITKKSRAHILGSFIYKTRDRRDIKKVQSREIIRIIEKNLKSGST